MTIDAVRLIATVLIGALAVAVATRVSARVHPSSYFGMSELISGLDRPLSWRSFALRLAIPFVAGAVVGLFNPEARAAAGAASAGLAALLVIWSPLLYDHMLPYAVQDRQREVRVIYALYLIAHVLLGLAGGSLAGLAMEQLAPSGIAQWFKDADIPTLTPILESVIGGLLGAGILAIVIRLIARLRGREE